MSVTERAIVAVSTVRDWACVMFATGSLSAEVENGGLDALDIWHPPPRQFKKPGLWVFEGTVEIDSDGYQEYPGTWRRATDHEVLLAARGDNPFKDTP